MTNFQLMKYGLIPILLISLFFSCTKNEDTEIIEREKFVNILTELHITEGIMTDKGWYDGRLPDSTKSYYSFVLKKYDISRVKFDNSLAYYSANLEDLMKIYDEVIVKINNKIPKKFDSNSIYNIIGNAIEEAKMRHDPSLRFGIKGTELWAQKNYFNFPVDTSRTALKLEKEIKHQCLLVLNADYMILPKNKSNKIKMNMIVLYKDTTADTLEKQIKIKNDKWDNQYLVFKTDSSKTPIKIKSTIFEVDSITSNTFVNIRSVSLKQFAPNKDTTGMFVKPIVKPVNKDIFKKNAIKSKRTDAIR